MRHGDSEAASGGARPTPSAYHQFHGGTIVHSLAVKSTAAAVKSLSCLDADGAIAACLSVKAFSSMPMSQ